jgi:hypothetical protein
LLASFGSGAVRLGSSGGQSEKLAEAFGATNQRSQSPPRRPETRLKSGSCLAAAGLLRKFDPDLVPGDHGGNGVQGVSWRVISPLTGHQAPTHCLSLCVLPSLREFFLLSVFACPTPLGVGVGH